MNFYISFRFHSVQFKMIDLFYQIYFAKVKTFRIKTFLNENFDSNKRAHIDKFEKDNLL